jgi:predicted Zn-dependent protease
VGAYLAGVVAQEQGRIDDSRREFQQALKLQPGTTEALVALVRLEIAHGESAAALQRLRAMVAAEPQNALAQNLLGEALIATQAYPEAIAQLTHTTEIAPKLALSYRNLALANLRTQNYAGATAAYEAGLKQLPYDIGLTAGLAEIYVQQGQPDKAIALYQALLGHDPHQELASNNLAMLLVTHRRDRASLDLARDLTANFANSESGALLDTNGWVRLKLGNVNDALTTLQRAASRAPDSRVIRYHLAMAELQAGERDKARSNLEAALAGSAEFSGSAEARAALNSLRAGGRS